VSLSPDGSQSCRPELYEIWKDHRPIIDASEIVLIFFSIFGEIFARFGKASKATRCQISHFLTPTKIREGMGEMSVVVS